MILYHNFPIFIVIVVVIIIFILKVIYRLKVVIETFASKCCPTGKTKHITTKPNEDVLVNSSRDQ